jgi:hypothetical protein
MVWGLDSRHPRQDLSGRSRGAPKRIRFLATEIRGLPETNRVMNARQRRGRVESITK